ncbi:MAG: hypothetical protein K2X98_00720 [Alphaproteobacteria bacterium]|nr:hypothetical protein [Alphaproteobacteria bacterium]MBX9976760.1 hypothetical protein [Alphaproteobacteria bacterium]
MMNLNKLRRTMTLTASLLGTVVISSQSGAHAKLTGEDDDHPSLYTLKGESSSRADVMINKTAKKDAVSEEALESQSIAVESSLSEQVIQAAKKAKNRLNSSLSEDEPSNEWGKKEHPAALRIRHTTSIVDGSMAEETPLSFGPLSTEPSILDHWFDESFSAVKKYFS